LTLSLNPAKLGSASNFIHMSDRPANDYPLPEQE
jgi:hypothetical protein